MARLIKKVDSLEFEVSYHHKNNIFDMPETKKEKVALLKGFISREIRNFWSAEPRNVAAYKRQYLRELIEALL